MSAQLAFRPHFDFLVELSETIQRAGGALSASTNNAFRLGVSYTQIIDVGFSFSLFSCVCRSSVRPRHNINFFL